MEQKKLYRLHNDKKIAGVASGLGTYFNIDPVIVRVLFLLSALTGGIGILAYIILVIVLPQK